MSTSRPADEEAIRRKAYHFWEEEGRPEGRETEFWMRAVVALTDKAQADTIVDDTPKDNKPKNNKPKAAASRSRAAPAKASKPKKK